MEIQVGQRRQGHSADALRRQEDRQGDAGNYLRVALAQLELTQPDLGWYEATRHTFASQWVLAGNSIEKLSAILGHYSIVMTERYAHLRPELFTRADLATIKIDLRPSGAKVGELGHRMATDPTNPTPTPQKKKKKMVGAAL